MADKTIGNLPPAKKIYELPTLSQIMDDSLLAIEHQSVAHKLQGSVFKAYAIEAAKGQADIATDAAARALASQTAAKGSEDKAKESETKALASQNAAKASENAAKASQA